jgi:hypothetical protein
MTLNESLEITNAVNETIINATVTKDDIFLNTIAQGIGFDSSSSLVYWVVMGSLFLMIYLLTGRIKKIGVRILTSLSPVFISDGLLPIVFPNRFEGFGTYVFELPFGTYTSPFFYKTLTSIEYILHYKFFTHASNVISTYSESAVIDESSISLKILVLFYSFIDTIWQIFLFVSGFYLFFTMIENHYRGNNKANHVLKDLVLTLAPFKLLIALILGIVPNAFMAMIMSNPFHEYSKALDYLNNGIYFISNATNFDLLYVLVIGAFCYIMVFMFVYIITHLVAGIYMSSSLSGGLQDMSANYPLYAGIITTVYSLIYIMHPDYQWTYIFFMLIAWFLVKKGFDKFVSEAKTKNNKYKFENEQAELLADKVISRIGNKSLNNDGHATYNSIDKTTYHKNYDNSRSSYLLPFILSMIFFIFAIAYSF